MDDKAKEIIEKYNVARKALKDECRRVTNKIQAEFDVAVASMDEELRKELEAIFGDKTFDGR